MTETARCCPIAIHFCIIIILLVEHIKIFFKWENGKNKWKLYVYKWPNVRYIERRWMPNHYGGEWI